jgi:hypothetical protein
MGRFDLSSARSVVGHNVNLHLKDGSVIINVLITDVERKNHGKRATVYYTTPTKRVRKVHLREIEWAERLDPHVFMGLITFKKRRIRSKQIEIS